MAAWQIVAGTNRDAESPGVRVPDLFVGLTPAGSVVRSDNANLSRFTSRAMALLVAARAATPYDHKALNVVESLRPSWDADAMVVENGLDGGVFEVASDGGRVYRSSDPAATPGLARREALYVARLLADEGHHAVRVEDAQPVA